MREEVLRKFFLGQITASRLAQDLRGSLVDSGSTLTHHPIVDMNLDFDVRPEHLIKVCDAVLSGTIEAKYLAAIGFCLAASDHFNWETDEDAGELVADVANDWSAYMVNYPLTISNVRKWRHLLETGENTFTTQDLKKESVG